MIKSYYCSDSHHYTKERVYFYKKDSCYRKVLKASYNRIRSGIDLKGRSLNDKGY